MWPQSIVSDSIYMYLNPETTVLEGEDIIIICEIHYRLDFKHYPHTAGHLH